MNTIEFIAYLHSLGAKLYADGDRLHCNAPKGVLTPEVRAELANRKAEILEFLRSARVNVSPVLPVSRERNLPLSFAQQRLWFIDQLQPGLSIYNMPAAFHITGSLDVTALEQSLNAILQRHEVLRTTFSVVNGQPVQVIAPAITFTLPVIDLQGLPEPEREIEARRLADEEARRPFDLAQGPLFRATLLHLDSQEHILLLSMHHIVSDEWSMGILFQEFSNLYNAISGGKPSPLPELPIQYADFTIWQREQLQGEVLESQLTYWKKQLNNAPPMLELPTDRPRPSAQTFRGAQQSIMIAGELAKALKALSHREKVTLFMTLLAAFQTLLYRYTGQKKIVVGSPIANRNRAEIEALIGFFVNTLVLSTDFSDNPTFSELLTRVREVVLGAYTHQDLPFEKLVEELQPERTPSRHPLFQVMFVLQNPPRQSLEFSNLTLSRLKGSSQTTKFDLTLFITETAEGLRATFSYNTDLFDSVTIKRMLDHFQTLLQGIAANPETAISHLPLLTDIEQHQLLVAWNDTGVDSPNDLCIHQLFEAQVEQNPDAVAVIFEDQQLTYRQLNSRTNQLAHYLTKRGVGPDLLVGICVERSIEMVVGLLGILKAGGAYVPLDPTYPQERLAFMLTDSQARVLLTQTHLVDKLSLASESKTELVNLDSDWQVIAQENEQNPASRMTVGNLAYVIYTSGSTGKPKGVALSHRALANLINWQLHHSASSASTRTLQFTSLSFDVSFQEIFATWCSGGILVMVPESVRRDIESLAQFIATEAIERLFLPFVALQQLAQAINAQEQLSFSLKEIITAGEQLQLTQPIIRLFNRLKSCTLYNHFGPTESHVVTAFALAGNPDCWPMLPPIGRPIANTQLYILDDHLQPVPIGVSGQLHLGGVGLARGYLNALGLTAKRFVPNPFTDFGLSSSTSNPKSTQSWSYCAREIQNPKSTRLYKTGDLARYLPDGNIEFLGRTDHQTKIRGFRIEPGEIETVLSQHPSVRETVVQARETEDESGEQRLVAYIVPNREPTPTTSELRHFLGQKLPEYMVPSAFIMLEAIPLTPSGKLDRQALPAPDRGRPELEKAFIPPRNDLEIQLVRIWEQVLDIQPIGIKDNFFDLGGHSLLAVSLFAEIEQGLDKKLPLASLFQAPTIEELAQIVRQEGWTPPWRSLVPIQPNGSKPPFFCVHAIGGHVLGFRDLALHLGPEQSFYGIQARGLNDEAEPHAHIEDMAAAYIEEMRALKPEGPYFLGGFCTGGIIAFEMAQQLLQQGEQVGLLAMIDTFTNFSAMLSQVSLSQRAKLHNHNLSQLRLGEKLTYLYRYGSRKVPRITRGAAKKLRKMVPKRYLKKHRPIPSAVRHTWLRQGLYHDYPELGIPIPQGSRHVSKVHQLAFQFYTPHLYPGRITLFWGSEGRKTIHLNSRLGWGRLAAGGVEICRVPGHHLTLLTEPHVRGLAEKLSTYLNEI